MQPEIREQLEKAGIDVSGALDRFMGSDDLLKRFLLKFLNDSNYEKLKTAMEAGDQEAALTAAHTLKGVSGNLSITELFDLLTKQVAAFRAGDWEEAKKLMPHISLVYEQAVDGINKLK